ncbi:MAG TPA: MBL fold metallo-hydrolase [Saprospiraceae bacterium]|nr:MBL fold metallo-hydrolase [Saprospiraceae bacterium]HMQ84021.1 MBL fold metallo-hydrolase [Saprospiraceae bacterium]
MKVKFCGAAKEVTGSSHLLRLDNGFSILLDCGLYQGNSESMTHFNENWLFDPKEIDCMILSHAHIDHSGRIPKLVRDGFRGSIYCTHATRSLCSIMLLDSAHIQEMDTGYFNKRLRKKGFHKDQKTPLYTSKDAMLAMNQFVGHTYNRWFSIHPDVDVLFQDAGHILGSASVSLRIQEGGRSIHFGFSGDVGRPFRPILRDPQPMPEMDYLICESTYGNRLHEEGPAEIEHFLDIIRHTCLEKKGKLIIPAFSIGRTQEIVYLLDQLETNDRLPHIPVYVDSPLAVNATQIFGSHPECFDNDLNEYLLIDDNPFGFNSLTYIRDKESSQQLNHSNEPCIIISSSGMMNAGRVKHHLYHNIDDPRNTFLMVGYCSPHTPGGKLRAGVEEIRIFGDWKPVKAEIAIMDSFSAHADKLELIDFIKNQKASAKKLFLVHGEPEVQSAFQQTLHDIGFQEVIIPELGEAFELR